MPKTDITATLGLNNSPAMGSLKQVRDAASRPINANLNFNLGKFTSDFTKFEQSLDAATARVVAFTATTSLIYGVGSAFKRLTQDAIQIESTMARIQSIFGSTASETKQFQSAIFNLADDVGLSFSKVAEAAEEFSRQGLTLNKTLEATRAAAIVAKLSGAELKGVIEGLTATLSTFNDGTLDYIQVANKLVALDSAFATSAAGISDGLKRVAGVAVEAGLSFDQTAAAITALKQVTGRSEAVIGNSLKSIFTSLQTEKVQKDLGALGVETKDASGEFRNLVDVLSDLSKVYSTLGDAQKALIAQKIGKTYQANAFQGILKTFETGDYSKALKTSQNAGDSAENRLDKLNQTTEAALQRFSNNITKLGGNLGDKLGKPLLDTVVGYMNSAIDAGNKIFGGSGLGDALIGGLKNVLGGPGIAVLTFAISKLLVRIAKESGQAIKSIAGLSGAKENILKIDQFITSNLNDQDKLELKRIEKLTSVAAQQKAILDLMNRQLATQEKMRSQGALPSLGITALQSLGPAAASKAARKIPNRGKGELPEVNAAILREAVDIRNGVGGARATATPLVKTLNIGRGPQKVVVNSDEKIIPNFAGSGQHAVLNREMMGLAVGKVPFSSKLGTGAFGSFYKYKKGNLGYKTVEPIYLKDAEGGLAVDFYSLKKINALKDSGELPRYFDSVKTVGTLDRALKRNRLGKTVADGKVVSNLGAPGTNEFFLGLQKHIAAKTGINFTDFHNGNFTANPAAEKAIKSAVKSLGGKVYSSENRDIIFDKIHKSLLSNKKAKLTVFDPGDYYSSGYIPSLAKGKLTRKQLENQQKVITKALDAEIINQKKQSTRLKNLRDLPSKGLYSGVAVPATISTPGALTTNLGAAGLNQLRIPKELPQLDLFKSALEKKYPFLPNSELGKIQQANIEGFEKDLSKEFSKNLKPIEIQGASTIAERKLKADKLRKVRALNQANRKRDRELKLYQNKQQREEFARIRDKSAPSSGSFFNPRGNEFLKSASLFDTSNSRSTFAGGGGVYLQNNPAPVTTSGVFSGSGPLTSTESLHGGKLPKRLSKSDKIDNYLISKGFDIRSMPSNFKQFLYRNKATNLPQPTPPPIPGSAAAILPPLSGSNTTTGTFATLPPLAGIPGAYSKVNPTRKSSSPNYTPISPIGKIAKPTPPPEKTGLRPTVDVTGDQKFREAAQNEKIRARAEKISNLIDSGKKLSATGKEFVNSNKNLFQESTLSKFDKKNLTLGDKVKNYKSAISGGIKNFDPSRAAGAGFAISFIGGSIAESLKTKSGEDTQGSRAVGGIASGVGIGAQLALFGKTAGIIGLVAGAATGLNTAFGENLDRLNGLKEKHDNLIESYRKEEESLSLFSTNFQNLADALDSGSESAVKLAKQGIGKALEGISDENLKKSLVSATTQEEISGILTENQNKKAQSLSLSSGKVEIGDLLQSNRQGFFGEFFRKNDGPSNYVSNFLGLNDGLNGGNVEKIASKLADSVDVSKFSEKQRKVYSEKGVSVSALPKDVQDALRDVESRFSGGRARVLSEISKKLKSKLSDNSSLATELERKAIKQQDFSNIISASSQGANLSIFQKNLKSSLGLSLAESSIQKSKPFVSDIAFSEAQFGLDRAKRSQENASRIKDFNSSLIGKAQELTKGKNFDFAQLQKIQGAFSRFGENQDTESFLKDFGGVIGTDSKELVKFVQEAALELKKLNSETDASNQIAEAQQRNIIEELKRGQRATLFGGGTSRFDRSQSSPGLIASLTGPKYNKYSDPNRPGVGLDEKSGRRTFTDAEFAKEEERALNANEDRYDSILKRIQYQKDTGYYGVEPTADTPGAVKNLRERLLESDRKDAAEAFAGKKKKFALDQGLSESNDFINQINADFKASNGGIAITKEQKKVIQDAIRTGAYEKAVSAIDESTSGIEKNYDSTGKTTQSEKIRKFKDSLRLQGENYSLIDQSAQEQAKGFLPSQSLEKESLDALKGIKLEEVKVNENLSKLTQLISNNETKDLNLSKTTAVKEGISELSTLSLKLAEKNSPLEFDKIKKDIAFDVKRGALSGNPLDPEFLKNFGGDGSSVTPESLGNYFKYKNKYEPSDLTRIYSNKINRFTQQDSIDRDVEGVKSKIIDTTKIKDESEKSKVLDSLIDSIQILKKELEKRESQNKTSSIDQNINLDINATVAGTNLLASDDFKNEMTQFVSSYISKVWKENTGKPMVTPPQMTA